MTKKASGRDDSRIKKENNRQSGITTQTDRTKADRAKKQRDDDELE